MKTLFQKSNILHIRTNEGEFVVINPEEFEAAWIPLGVTIEQYFKSFEGTDHPEWPGEVEIKCTKNCRTGADCDEIQGCNLVARLLPMVEKKPAQPTPNFPKGGTTFTESAYKEFEEEDKFSIPSVRNSPRSWPEDYEHENGNYISVCGECNNSFMGHKRRVRCKLCMQSVELPEPQEKEPTAYQKRKAIEKRALWLKYCLDIGWTKDQLDGLEKIWDQHHDEFGNLIKGVSAPSESQEEKMSYWQYQQFAEAAITQLKDRNEKLESENKALREENTRLTTKFIEEEHAADHPNENLSYWQYQQFTRAAITKLKEELVTTEKALRDQLEACEQHNKILCEQKVGLLKEIERLKAEVKNANSALDNISDMGHA